MSALMMTTTRTDSTVKRSEKGNENKRNTGAPMTETESAKLKLNEDKGDGTMCDRPGLLM